MTTTEIERVSVSSLAAGAATATVWATVHRRWLDPASGRLAEAQVRQQVSCRLAREDGRWLVVEFRLLSEQPLEVSGLR